MPIASPADHVAAELCAGLPSTVVGLHLTRCLDDDSAMDKARQTPHERAAASIEISASTSLGDRGKTALILVRVYFGLVVET